MVSGLSYLELLASVDPPDPVPNSIQGIFLFCITSDLRHDLKEFFWTKRDVRLLFSSDVKNRFLTTAQPDSKLFGTSVRTEYSWECAIL
jgi:hypothetical protein